MELKGVSPTETANISGQGVSVVDANLDQNSDQNLDQIKTSDLHVVETCPLLAPVEVKAELPITTAIAKSPAPELESEIF
jgi:3-deoxy-7-phosphoheptulonate synthase